jgi:hypothetical protein
MIGSGALIFGGWFAIRGNSGGFSTSPSIFPFACLFVLSVWIEFQTKYPPKTMTARPMTIKSIIIHHRL